MTTTVFNRLARSRPAKTEIELPRQNSPQILLDWLLQHWHRPTISVREIGVYGPRPIRDRETMINSAEALVRHGWLTELNAHRHDRRVWHIDRKPVIHPTVQPNN